MNNNEKKNCTTTVKKNIPFPEGINKTSKSKDELQLDDIFRNRENINIITNYLVEKSNINGILLRGPIGCGKFTLIKSCLHSLDYTYQLYDSDFENEDMFDRLMLSIQTKGFNTFFKKKKAIIIRNIDDALSSSQKVKFFKFLSSVHNTLPLFMTSSDFSIGTTREVPKIISQLTFENPLLVDFIILGTKIAKQYNINISKNALENLFKQANGDISYFQNTIINFKNQNQKILINKTFDYTKQFKLDTFNSIKFCGDTKNNWDSKILTSSSYTNSTVFQNYPLLVSDIETLSYITDMICKGEEIRAYSYSNHIWDTFENKYCLFGTVAPLLKIGDKFSIDVMTYPQSTNLPNLNFQKLELDGLILKDIIKPKYFEKNKFVGDNEVFVNKVNELYEPIKAYKLASIDEPKKIRETFIKELKKKI